MTVSDPPFAASFDLGTVRDRTVEVSLEPGPAERVGIAHWLGIESVQALKATIRLSRVGADEYVYDGSFEADVVQACVITLDPVPSHISGEIHRTFKVLPRPSTRRSKSPIEPAPAIPAVIDLSVAEDDGPELLDHPVTDLAAPLLEELSLSLDPYPKAPGAAFAAPPEPIALAENPFAVLEKLKKPPPARRPSPRASGRPAVKRQPGKKGV
jgi:uncharacterized metal-binding protein YceD (DUF177 family)